MLLCVVSSCWFSFIISYDIFKQSPLYETEIFSHYLWGLLHRIQRIISESGESYEQKLNGVKHKRVAEGGEL